MRISKQPLRKSTFQTSKADPASAFQVSAEDVTQKTAPTKLAPLPDPPDWPELPFQPSDPDAVYNALEMFYAEHPCTVQLHPLTGLPAYMRGDLQDPQEGSPVEAAQMFLQTNELMLTGLSDETSLALTRESDWAGGPHQVAFAQTNSDDVPLYGSNVVCSFAAERLTFLSSTLYPASVEEIDNLYWDDDLYSYIQEGREIALPFKAQLVPFEAPPNLRQESRDLELRADRWILPYWPDEQGPGTYRPVWRVIMVDESERHWLLLIDGETLEVLIYTPAWVEDTVEANVYLTDDAALQNHLDCVDLDYGSGNTMQDAERVHIKPRGHFAEPTGCEQSSDDQIWSANAFYHTFEGQKSFADLLSALTLNDLGDIPNPTEDINVVLQAEAGSGIYDPVPNTITLGEGTTTVEPPAKDCEVIYHELTHAVTYYLTHRPLALPTQMQKLFTKGLDEGLAFYFACDLGKNAKWAQFAYQYWGLARDLTQVPQLLKTVLKKLKNDPVDMYHALGMWWARVFWELRAQDKLGVECNNILVEALLDVAFPLSSAEPFGEAMLNNADSNQGQIIRDTFQEHGVELPS